MLSEQFVANHFNDNHRTNSQLHDQQRNSLFESATTLPIKTIQQQRYQLPDYWYHLQFERMQVTGCKITKV